MTLIVLDDEFACSPGGIVHVLYEPDAVAHQRGSRGPRIVRLEIEVEVLSSTHELDGGVLRIHVLQMEDLIAGPDTRVEVLVLEVQHQTHPGRVEIYRCVQIRRTQLGDDRRNPHGFSASSLGAAASACTSQIEPEHTDDADTTLNGGKLTLGATRYLESPIASGKSVLDRQPDRKLHDVQSDWPIEWRRTKRQPNGARVSEPILAA